MIYVESSRPISGVDDGRPLDSSSLKKKNQVVAWIVTLLRYFVSILKP
jgi:hypothetical protein